MEPVATTSAEYPQSCKSQNPVGEPDTLRMKKDHGGMFHCSFCPLEERYDYKGAKPPFSKAISYLEDCYVMKDPFSLPNKGEVLVLGADCSVCNKPACLGCSLFFVNRFCRICAADKISDFPVQLHAKIKSFKKDDTQLDSK